MVALEAMERGRAGDRERRGRPARDRRRRRDRPARAAGRPAGARGGDCRARANVPARAGLREAGRRRALADSGRNAAPSDTTELYEAALVRAGRAALARDRPQPARGRRRQAARAGSPTAPGSAPSRRRPSPPACCRRAGAAPGPEKRRGTRKKPAERERVERDHVQRLDDPAPDVAAPASATSRRLDRERRAPEHPHRLGGESRLLARVLAPEVGHLRRGRSASARTRPPRAQPRAELRRPLGPRRHAGQIGHVVDPAAAREHVVRGSGCSPSRAPSRRS